MPFRYHGLLIKRSHVASSPSIWIDKDFWFQSSPSPPTPFFPLSLLSLPLSSFILCIFGIERLGEKERERARAKKNNGRRAQERERDSFGVKGEVLVSSFLLLLSDWPFARSLNLGSAQRGWAVCHFAGGAGRGGARAGGGGAGCGAYAASRGEVGGLGGFGQGSADQSSTGVLAHVEEGGVVEEEGGGEAPSLAPRGPQYHLTGPLKTGKRQLATTGC